MSQYRRYHIETEPAPDVAPHPSRFRVRVRRHRLIGLLLKELVEYRGRLPVVLSRPCVYGVFGSKVGGLAPREHLCVGCLRCTVQYPHIVQIRPNPKRAGLGDSYLCPDAVDAILNEARTGRVPVRGAGYRGTFGGVGWDAMWTDMSEIVRPTRDGIHGREFISTAVEIGEKPSYLQLDALALGDRGEPQGSVPRVLSLQVPFLFDVPPRAVLTPALLRILAETARRIDSLAILPIEATSDEALRGPHVVPLASSAQWASLERLSFEPRLLFLDGWDPARFQDLARRFPDAIVGVRAPMDAVVLGLVRQGARVLHLVADYHGRVGAKFVADVLLETHRRLVDAGVREEVTLVGSGGIVLAEHVPKAIICGLDAVALDTSACVALQARFEGECRNRETAALSMPSLEPSWAIQRLTNLAASWRDQLREILGAMGLREVRRLRGEVGRCMFQKDLEREAFAEIEGYEA